jgi:hypothetical protein
MNLPARAGYINKQNAGVPSARLHETAFRLKPLLSKIIRFLDGRIDGESF